MATQTVQSFSKPMPPRSNGKNRKMVPSAVITNTNQVSTENESTSNNTTPLSGNNIPKFKRKGVSPPGSPTWRFKGRGPPRKALPKVNNNNNNHTNMVSSIDNNGAPPLQMSYTQPVEDNPNPSSLLKKSASANDVNNYMPVLSTSSNTTNISNTSNTSNSSRYMLKNQSPLPSLPSLTVINAHQAMDNNKNNLTHSPIIPNSPSVTSQLINQNGSNQITPTPPLKDNNNNNNNEEDEDEKEQQVNLDPDSAINALKDEIKHLEDLLHSKRKQLVDLEKNKLCNKVENMKPISLLKNFISFAAIANEKELDLIQEILNTSL